MQKTSHDIRAIMHQKVKVNMVIRFCFPEKLLYFTPHPTQILAEVKQQQLSYSGFKQNKS